MFLFVAIFGVVVVIISYTSLRVARFLCNNWASCWQWRWLLSRQQSVSLDCPRCRMWWNFVEGNEASRSWFCRSCRGCCSCRRCWRQLMRILQPQRLSFNITDLCRLYAPAAFVIYIQGETVNIGPRYRCSETTGSCQVAKLILHDRTLANITHRTVHRGYEDKGCEVLPWVCLYVCLSVCSRI